MTGSVVARNLFTAISDSSTSSTVTANDPTIALAAVDRIVRVEGDRDGLHDALAVIDAVPERAGGEGKNGVASGDAFRDEGSSAVGDERVARVIWVLVVEAEGTAALPPPAAKTAAALLPRAQRHADGLGRRDREVDDQVLYLETRPRKGRLGQFRGRRRREVREAVIYGRRRGVGTADRGGGRKTSARTWCQARGRGATWASVRRRHRRRRRGRPAPAPEPTWAQRCRTRMSRPGPHSPRRVARST